MIIQKNRAVTGGRQWPLKLSKRLAAAAAAAAARRAA